MANADCPKCGSAVGARDRFCSECGQAVQTALGKGLSPFGHFVKCLKKCTNFYGRARRKEFWSFVLLGAIFFVVMGTFDRVAFRFPVFCYIYSLLMLLPSFAVTVRRLHDIGRSGWYFPLWLIFVESFLVFGSLLLADRNNAGVFCMALAVAGHIAFTVAMAMRGDAGQNRYGPSPKGPVSAS
jgi:uncharacterized membrane protein YhaH (DUF805 family)